MMNHTYNPDITPGDLTVRQRVKPMPSRNELLKRCSFPSVNDNRTCTTGERNANSALYGAVWRAARAMGYHRCITYTQADESGASLRASGFVRVKDLPSRKGWADSSVSLKDKRDPVGNGGVLRTLWEIRRMK